MIHAGSSSHPKRRANYRLETKAPQNVVRSELRAHIQTGPITVPRALRSYTAPQVNHLNLPLALVLSRLQIFHRMEPRFFAYLQRFQPIATVFADSSAEIRRNLFRIHGAAASDTRSPRAMHASSTWTTSYGFQSRFRKSQSSAKKSITGPRILRCRVY